MNTCSQSEWDRFLLQYPEAHILQTSAWGILKSNFGWRSVWIHNETAGAQILFRKLPLGFHLGYIPKGPIGNNWSSLWNQIDSVCKEMRTVFLKVEPDCWKESAPDISDEFYGFTHSPNTIQPNQTIIIDLRGEEKQWIDRMKQKTRYNIRLAEKKSISIRKSNDIRQFHDIALITGKRNEFGIHTLKYYQKMYDLFSSSESCVLFMAYYEEKPLAGILVMRKGKRAWYLHGASNNNERNRMPTYLLQWEAMRWAASKGCTEYDLWGIPEVDEEKLETEFANRSDGLWGVYRFKRGFGGKIVHSTGSWDRIYMPFYFSLYQWLTKLKHAYN